MEILLLLKSHSMHTHRSTLVNTAESPAQTTRAQDTVRCLIMIILGRSSGGDAIQQLNDIIDGVNCWGWKFRFLTQVSIDERGMREIKQT